jgi:hypothetical protein
VEGDPVAKVGVAKQQGNFKSTTLSGDRVLLGIVVRAAAQLPLLQEMEERAGVRRNF